MIPKLLSATFGRPRTPRLRPEIKPDPAPISKPHDSFGRYSATTCTSLPEKSHAIALSKYGLLAVGAGPSLSLFAIVEPSSTLQAIYERDAMAGSISCIQWLEFAGQPLLVFGTLWGQLLIWLIEMTDGHPEVSELVNKRIGGGTEIMSVSGVVRDQLVRLAVCNWTTSVWVLDISLEGDNCDILARVSLQTSRPRSLVFNQALDVIFVAGHEDGALLQLNLVESRLTPKIHGIMCPKVGYASWDLGQGQVLVDNVYTGVGIFSLDSGTLVRHFPVTTTGTHLPRHTVFAEGGRAVVCGSDHNCVYVFDRTNGKAVAELHHQASDTIQTVAAIRINGVDYIASASSGKHQGHWDVCLWSRLSAPPVVPMAQDQQAATLTRDASSALPTQSQASSRGSTYVWQHCLYAAACLAIIHTFLPLHDVAFIMRECCHSLISTLIGSWRNRPTASGSK